MRPTPHSVNASCCGLKAVLLWLLLVPPLSLTR